MLTYLARFISFVFNPYFLIIPLPYLLVVRQTGDPVYAFKWMLFTTFFLLVIGLSVFFAVRRGVFSDLDISRREQRPRLFLLLSIFALMYFIVLYAFKGPLSLLIPLVGIFFSILVFDFINTRIKASIHVASITALIFSMSLLYNGIFLWLLFLIPLIGWSRLYIRRHTSEEVIMGAFLGIALPLVVYLIFKVLLGISLSA